MSRKHQPGLEAIDITSRGYWYEQFRRSAFDFDSQSVRPYFPYAQVEAGVLSTAARLFKIEFRPSDATAWHADVSVFDVFEDGVRVGRFYLDMHPREGKDKWFSAAPIVTGVRLGALPEAALICNFPAGDENGPGALIFQVYGSKYSSQLPLFSTVTSPPQPPQRFRQEIAPPCTPLWPPLP